MKKIYRVIKDTHNSHGMVNSFVRFAWNGDKETIIAKDTKTGKLIKFDVKDLKEAFEEFEPRGVLKDISLIRQGENVKMKFIVTDRSENVDKEFITDEKIENARLFAKKLI